MAQIAPSLFAADPLRLAEESKLVVESGADMLHFDLMDGHFVPAISFGTATLSALRTLEIPIDIHLMVSDPEKYIEECIIENTGSIAFHVEATNHARDIISQIHSHGILAGIAISPGTPVSAFEYLLGEIDFVIIMGIEPGCSGQTIIPSTLNRVKEIKAVISRYKKSIKIEVDGGMTLDFCSDLIDAGADILVFGRCFFACDNCKELVDTVHSKIAV